MQKKLLVIVIRFGKKMYALQKNTLLIIQHKGSWSQPLWTAWYKLNKLVPGKLAPNKVEYNQMITVCLVSGNSKIFKNNF